MHLSPTLSPCRLSLVKLFATNCCRFNKLILSKIQLFLVIALYTFSGTAIADLDISKILAEDEELDVGFGYSVSVFGNTAIIGAPRGNGGAAYIYTRDEDGVWSKQSKLSPSIGIISGEFGSSVYLTKDKAIIGAPNRGCLNSAPQGAVYIFERSDENVWTQQAKLTPLDASPRINFGASVHIDSDTVLVGAPDCDHLNTETGAVYVYKHEPENSWSTQVRLTPPEEAPDDYFGSSIHMSGDLLIVGSPSDEGVGSAYIFSRGSNGNWSQSSKLVPSDRSPGARFGFNTSIYGETALVGTSVRYNEGLEDTDAVYVYELQASGSWAMVKKLSDENSSSGNSFGISTSLFEDIILVGSEDDEVHMYSKDSSGVWLKQGEIRVDSTSYHSTFGRSTSMAGNQAVIGDTTAEAVYIIAFDLNDDDGDSIFNSIDNCPTTANTEQLDSDDDGTGDVCDQDDDNDGTPDVSDDLPLNDKESVDTDSDGIGNNADLDDDGDGILDGWETTYGLDPLVNTDGFSDLDEDGFSNRTEFLSGTSLTDSSDNPETATSHYSMIFPNDAAMSEHFGNSISISGNTALVDTDSRAGEILVFDKDSSGEWVQSFIISLPKENVWHQRSIALSGDTAVIGATDLDAAYVFKRNESGDWVQKAVLVPDSTAHVWDFGGNVAIHNDAILIGAPAWHDGSAFIFTQNGFGGWEQKAKLTPTDGISFFGSSISLTDDTALVGAPNTFGNGAAYVYVKESNGNWKQQAKLMPSDSTYGDEFGESVSIVGNMALIGAPTGDYGHGTSPGAAYIFERDGLGNWIEQTKFTAIDTTSPAAFGRSVFLSQNLALIGTYTGYSGPGGTMRGGAVYLFLRDSNGKWSKRGYLSPSKSDRLFGSDISYSSGTVLVGAPSGWPEMEFGSRTLGVTYAFELNFIDSDNDGVLDVSDNCLDTPNNNQLDTDFDGEGDTCDADDDNDGSPDSVDVSPLDNNEFLDSDGDGIGDNADSDDDNDRIPDYIEEKLEFDPLDSSDGLEDKDVDGFTNAEEYRSGTSLFEANDTPDTVKARHFRILSEDGSARDYFGSSIAISGSTAVIGAPGDDERGEDVGAAYIYTRNSEGMWVQQEKLTPKEIKKPNARDRTVDSFGQSVAISDNTILIGAYSRMDGNGSAHVFVLDTQGDWSHQAVLTGSQASSGSNFGVSIAIDENTAFVGADENDNHSTSTHPGAVYVFTRNSSGSWSETEILSASDNQDNNFFGRSLSVNNNRILIGASGYNQDELNTGAAYLFERNEQNKWVQTSKLLVDTIGSNSKFGESVSLYGDTALVSAPGHFPSTYNGPAYIFQRDTTGNWQLDAELTPQPNNHQSFGKSVLLYQNTALISGWNTVNVFSRNTDGAWLTKGYFNGNNTFSSGLDALAISGNSVLAGNYWDDDNGGTSAGAAFSFELDLNDNDNDNIFDISDNCILAQNSDQIDTDEDGRGDICDEDDDNDGVPDTEDEFPLDRLKTGDTDGDTIDDKIDNCPEIENSSQLDTDLDKLGDACDLDDDNDGISDDEDALPTDPTDSVDTDSDGIGNNTDLDDDGDEILDTIELHYGLSPLNYADGNSDLDGDGFINKEEILAGLDPNDHTLNPSTIKLFYQKILAGDQGQSSKFGVNVDISDNTAIVSIGFFNSLVGAAYIYEKDASGTWIQKTKLTPADSIVNNGFGTSVVIAGDIAFVGAPADDDNGEYSGAVYQFSRDSNGDWIQKAKIIAHDANENDIFGQSISFSGNTLLVGAPGNRELSDAPFAGAAYVFEVNKFGDWHQQSKIVPSERKSGSHFGVSVSLLANTVLVGSPNYDNLNETGSAYIFVRDNENTWNQQAKLTASDANLVNFFGADVSLSGDTALVGSSLSSSHTPNSGAAYIYQRNDQGDWLELTKLIAPDAGAFDYFGAAVSLNKNVAIIGALYHDEQALNSGAAYLFYRDTAGSWKNIAKLSPPGLSEHDYFGFGIALSSDTLLLGSTGDDENGSNAGAIYSYNFSLTDEDNDSNLGINDNCPFIANADQIDSDGDRWGDACDAFPLDTAEWIDHDSDGVGDNADNDDDNDRVSDLLDIAPYNPAVGIDVRDSDNGGGGQLSMVLMILLALNLYCSNRKRRKSA